MVVAPLLRFTKRQSGRGTNCRDVVRLYSLKVLSRAFLPPGGRFIFERVQMRDGIE
jgi:hypothetical protein